METHYRIRIKQGEMEFDIEGDKEFVQTRFESLSWTKKNVVVKPRGELAGTESLHDVIPVSKEKKKRGRKPKVIKVVGETIPVVSGQKKRGRKPKVIEPLIEATLEPNEEKKLNKASKRPVEENQSKIPEPKPGRKVRSDLKDKPLSELITLKNTQKDSERVILVGYYINKNQKKREFRSNDIFKVLKANNLPEPANINYHLRKLTDDQGFLVHGRKQGRYKLSDTGVKWVEYN